MLAGLIKNTVILSVLVLIMSIVLVFYFDFKEAKDRQLMIELSEKNKLVLTKENSAINKFKVEFDQAEWDLLLLKLNHTRYFERLDDQYAARHEYGFDPEYAEILINHWKTKYDWKKKIEYMNKYPQYKLVLSDGVTIHFVRYITNKDLDQTPIKLMMVDGWAGHYFGFFKMIEFIEKIFDKQSFDIVVPSLPGYGYSTPLTKNVDQLDTAQYFDALMRFIHDDPNCRYFVHAEDFGAAVANIMAQIYPYRVGGIHLTMPAHPLNSAIPLFYGLIGHIMPSLVLNAEEQAAGLSYKFFDDLIKVVKWFGYFHIQATKPDTLAHGLTDSPVGLMGWILAGYSWASFNFDDAIGQIDGKLNNFDRDDLLTILTYYWMTNSASSAIRFYKTLFHDKVRELEHFKISVPLGVHRFKNEVNFVPKSVLTKFYLNITSYKLENYGGHFASFENPEASAKDFIRFVNLVN